MHAGECVLSRPMLGHLVTALAFEPVRATGLLLNITHTYDTEYTALLADVKIPKHCYPPPSPPLAGVFDGLLLECGRTDEPAPRQHIRVRADIIGHARINM